MAIKFKQLHPHAVLPTRGHPTDAGLDLTINNISRTENGDYCYGFGVAVEIPEGHVGLLVPRSSVHKKHLQLSNSLGIIDVGYSGEIKAIFRKTQSAPAVYELGDRAAQLVIVSCNTEEAEFVDELPQSSRGQGGYGSTGA